MIDPTNEPDGRHRLNGHDPDAEDALADRVIARLAAIAGARQLPASDSPPSGAVLRPPIPPDPQGRRWFLARLASDLRLAVRMYFDPHYRVSRTAQFMLPVVLGLFVLNYFAFGVWLAIPFVSPILERVICVLLGVFLYMGLIRELGRYREVLDYLARYGSPR